MERGFLSSGKKDKANVDLRGELAKQVKDIEGKVLGSDGKPLKSILKRPKDVAANVNSDMDVKDLQYSDVNLKSSATTDGGNMQDSILVANMDHDDAFDGSLKAAEGSFASMFSESVSENAPVMPKRINFRSLVNEKRVSNHDTVLLKAAKESVMSRFKEVKMVIPVDEDDGSGHISEVICVEYEWKPPHCLDCKIFGHNSEKYPNKVIVTDDNVKNLAKNNDGFTEVVSRKNKGKKAVNKQLNNLIAGLQFHKPKSTFYRPVNKKGNDKQDKKKPADVKASSSHTCGDNTTLISNTFSVLNSEEGADCGDPFLTNATRSVQNDEGVQKPNSSTEEAVAECKKDSLWSKFKATKVASKSNPRTTLDFEEESDEDEVYFPNEKYTSGMGGGFTLEDDDLEYYDGYEAQDFDMPGYDIRLNSRHRK
ncbi:hypothetical protein Tco_0139161 [Tanacetum coccineum]